MYTCHVLGEALEKWGTSTWWASPLHVHVSCSMRSFREVEWGTSTWWASPLHVHVSCSMRSFSGGRARGGGHVHLSCSMRSFGGGQHVSCSMRSFREVGDEPLHVHVSCSMRSFREVGGGHVVGQPSTCALVMLYLKPYRSGRQSRDGTALSGRPMHPELLKKTEVFPQVH